MIIYAVAYSYCHGLDSSPITNYNLQANTPTAFRHNCSEVGQKCYLAVTNQIQGQTNSEVCRSTEAFFK